MWWKSGSTDLEYNLDVAAWVFPGKINAMKNRAHCKWGLTTLPDEVSMRFITLLSLFDCTHLPVCGGKVGQLT